MSIEYPLSGGVTLHSCRVDLGAVVALLVVLVDQLPVRGDLVAVPRPDDQSLGRPRREVVPQVPELLVEGRRRPSSRRANTHPARSTCPATRRCVPARPRQTHERREELLLLPGEHLRRGVGLRRAARTRSPNGRVHRSRASRSIGAGVRSMGVSIPRRPGRRKPQRTVSSSTGSSRHQAQHVEVAAVAAQHIGPQPAGLRMEHVVGEGRLDHPRVLGESRPPAARRPSPA